MAFSLSRNERAYAVVESTYGTVPSIVAADAFKFKKLVLTPSVADLVREDKTGTRSRPAGIGGRRSASGSVSMNLAPSGTAGTAPDIDPLLQSLFGAAPTVSAGVSVTYALADTIKSFSLASFRTPSTVMQRIAAGSVVTAATFNLGQDIADVSFDFVSKWLIDSKNFSALDTAGKCGLGSFPSEPSSPVTAGGIVPGFTGSFTVGGTTYTGIRSANIRISSGNELTRDTFGSYYPDSAEGDIRNVALSFSVYDEDTAAITALYTAALARTAVDVVAVIGTVAGSIMTVTVNNVQLAQPALDDGARRWSASFGDSPAHATSDSVTDEVTVVFT